MIQLSVVALAPRKCTDDNVIMLCVTFSIPSLITVCQGLQREVFELPAIMALAILKQS